MINFRQTCAFALVLACPGLAATSLAGEAGPITAKYVPQEVARDTYVIHGPTGRPSPENQGFMNNPGFIVTSAGVVVVDAGGSVQAGRMVLETIREVTDNPVVAVFATHIHGDHWLGNQAIREAFPDVVLYAHPKLMDEASAGAADTWLSLMMQMSDGATSGTEAVIPDTPVVHGDKVRIGDHTFAIHHQGQAHTKSDIAIQVLPGNTLFAGDLALNARFSRMDDGQFIGLQQTLDQLQALDPAVVVPGHGLTGGIEILRVNQALFANLYKTVEVLYEEGRSDFEMKSDVLTAVKEFHDWDGFEEGIGRMISQAYLEVEENNF